MTTAKIELPPKLIPVFSGEADVRGAYGGRGSAKTRSFAKMTAVRAYVWDMAGREGQILCLRQFMNSLADSSLEEIKAAIRSEPWLLERFEIGEKFIRTKSGRVYYSFSGLDRNVDSIKSKARILLGWVDEAEPVVEEAWQKLIPTLREEDSELWVTWNPERKNSATHKRFRESVDPRMKVVELNWRDNPWFPEILDRVRLRDKASRPDSYEHIWEGDFVSVVEGAYFASHLTAAKTEGRIGRVAADPLMTLRLFVDIGGTGAKADSFVIWVAQFIGKEIRVIDYYEAQGQPLATHLGWLRSKGYGPERAQFWLPHDGSTQDKVFSVSYESALRDAGYSVTVVPNQGKGAAAARIEAVRRLFPSIWFNAETTEAGRDALGWYHEKRDEARNIGLGPEHDWSSHGCFAGETEVLTRYGMRRMMDLPETGEVLTPCGWKQYILPRITKRNAPLVEVAFTDGHTVKCTPDHLFMTASGWKSAESLQPNTEILSTLTRSRSISMAVSTGFGRAKSIFREVAGGFTEMFGSLRLGQFRTDATSITSTGTCSTTNLTTSNAYRLQGISQSPGQNVSSLKTGGSRQPLGTKQQSGMRHQRGAYGTSGMQSARSLGPSGQGKKSPASIAALLSRLWSGKAAMQASSAPRSAKQQHTELEASRTNTLLHIASVKKLNETADVWDITVPDGHWFSLANGAVVHNSDAFGLMCVAYEEPVKETVLPKRNFKAV